MSLLATTIMACAPSVLPSLAPAPVDRARQHATIWIDRERVWTGPADLVDQVLDEILFDRIGPPEVPPWEPRPIEGDEICVGTLIREAAGDHLDQDVMELDCEPGPVR